MFIQFQKDGQRMYALDDVGQLWVTDFEVGLYSISTVLKCIEWVKIPSKTSIIEET